MNIARAFYDRLTGVIGNTRVYPAYVREADKVYPLACYKIENVTPQMASDGPTGLVSADYVIAAIDTTYNGSVTLANAIQTALDGATWTDNTNGVVVQGCFLKDDGREEETVTQQDTEVILYFVTTLTFLVWHAAT
jgi:hypothetical protein